jgi:glutaminyl-tRNA synthetase
VRLQFERHGYFIADRVDHRAGRPVFNRITGLKDGYK